jgi:D-alanyl-D-alanine carboxypeptidase
MPDIRIDLCVDGVTERVVDRRTLLAGAAGTVVAAGLAGSERALGATGAAHGHAHFDPVLASRLQADIRAALRDPSAHAPGAILHVNSRKLGNWTDAAGLGQLTPRVAMRPGDRFRAGSIIKPFVAVVVLQLAERGRLSLDSRLPAVMPASAARLIPHAHDITVRMLLGHRSGIAEWDTPDIDEYIARHPAKVWTLHEILTLAAKHPPVFAPGAGFFYSNTDYNLLGLIVEHLTGRSWRGEIARRVIAPLKLRGTYLPTPGHRSIQGAHAHGYREVGGRIIDVTRIDPSVAGAAGGGALVTTLDDLARFLDAVFAGRVFRHRRTLREMLTLAPAQSDGGLTGYGLGIEQRTLPGGVQLVGHLGTAGGYRSYIGRVRPGGATIGLDMNYEDDPTSLLLSALHDIAAAQH